MACKITCATFLRDIVEPTAVAVVKVTSDANKKGGRREEGGENRNRERELFYKKTLKSERVTNIPETPFLGALFLKMIFFHSCLGLCDKFGL